MLDLTKSSSRIYLEILIYVCDLRERGFENIYTPYCTAERQATAKRFDKDIRGTEWAIEQDLFKKTWHHILKKGDPLL